MQDDLEPARVAARGQYSDAFLAAIDAGLTVRPEMRPQNLQAFQRLLDATAAPPMAGPRRAEAEVPKARALSPAMGMLAAGLAAAAVVLGVVVVAWALLR